MTPGTSSSETWIGTVPETTAPDCGPSGLKFTTGPLGAGVGGPPEPPQKKPLTVPLGM